ncbi:hypothetical protein [Streptomyces sp. WZ-12]|uniref:hypothetical protein n=1 Tax=Streptomyces sp. WZ-12 TaxID=3030210 RepID=UPI0023810F3F|nr:hypothetical protein [Streptomyces sp. WZ-12]
MSYQPYQPQQPQQPYPPQPPYQQQQQPPQPYQQPYPQQAPQQPYPPQAPQPPYQQQPYQQQPPQPYQQQPPPQQQPYQQPPAPPQPQQPDGQQQPRTYACPSCGSTTEYAPGTSALRCPNCRFEQPIAPVNREVREHAWEELAGLPPKPLEPGGQALKCPGCGAVNETTALSGRCQFCSTPLVASAAGDRIAPEGLVPFRVAKREVHDNLRTWARSRWFAPNNLKKVSAAETLHGTYVPHWTYDAETSSTYRGQRGEEYTVGSGDTKETKVRWYRVNGSVQRVFDDVLVPGVGNIPAERLQALEPWPLKQAVAYQEEYLAGFRTLRYEVEPEAGFQTAQQKMAEVIEKDVKRDIGGDRQRVHEINTDYAAVTYKLLMLPVWFASYVYNGKQWQVMVNAETGEVTGDRPYSPWKIAFAVIILAIVVATLVLVFNRHH